MIREPELKQMISAHSLNIIFLVETDTCAVNEENDYRIPGFKTLVQNKKETTTPTRIICLVDECMKNMTKIRMDLTTKEFPSLWVEVENPAGKNINCGGFYREWAPGGDKTVHAQVEAMKSFTNQIERAASEEKTMVVLGDANLCSDRWDSPTFPYKKVAEELRDTLTHCGLELSYLGTTYTADRLGAEDQEITSALDHIYVSRLDRVKMVAKKLPNSATDHAPIMATLNLSIKAKPAPNQRPTVLKRNMRNFTKTRWIDALRNQE